jgi:hypothetical protein
MPSLSSGSVGDVRGPDYTRMAIRAKWRKARAAKNGDAMLEALDEAESRGSTVSGSVTQDEDQAMRGIAAQEARAAAAKLYMLRKASGNGPEELKAAKNRLNAAGGESSLTVPQAPPTSAVAPGSVGPKGAEGPAGGALASSMSKVFGSDTTTVGPDEDIPFGFRETGVAKGGRKMIASTGEQGPPTPPSLTARLSGPAVAPISEKDLVTGKATGLTDYGREYLKRRYARGASAEVGATMIADKKEADRNLEEQKTIRDATSRADAASTGRRNANAQAFRRRAMALEDRKTAATDLRRKRTIAELEAGQQDVVNRMDALADEEEAADKRTTIGLPRNTRKIAGMLRPLKVYRAKQ